MALEKTEAQSWKNIYLQATIHKDYKTFNSVILGSLKTK